METMTATKQAGLNELVTKKIDKAIANGTLNAQAAVDRLIKEGDAQSDFIVPIGKNGADVLFDANGKVIMKLDKKEYYLHPNAIGQLPDKLKMKVPAYSLRDMAEGEDWERIDVARLLNDYVIHAKHRECLLIRSVGSEIRGVMSDQYRRLNSSVILESFIKEAFANGALLLDGHMSDTRIYVETILPTPIIIPTLNNGNVAIAFGCRFSSSDYGDGALDVRAFFMQGICLNGAVRESMMRVVHLGSRLPDNLELSEKTYKLDTQTNASAIKDITSGMFQKREIERRSHEILRASEIEVDFDKEFSGLKRKNVSETEIVEMKKVFMGGNPEDGVAGTNTLWKLANGVGAISRTKEAQRKRELEEIAGALLDRAKQ